MSSGDPVDEEPDRPDQDPAATPGAEATFGMRRLARNLGALLSSTVVERATSFALYAIVARNLGATDLGRLALAIAAFQVVSKFTVLGLPTLTTREVARRPDRVGAYLANGALLVLIASIIGYGALLVFIWGTGYEVATNQVIWAVFAGLLPYCWSQLTEATLIGLERANLVAAINVPSNIAQVVLSYFLIRWGYGIQEIAFSIALMYAGVAAAQLVLVVWRLQPAWVPPNLAEARGMTRAAVPFFGIEGILALRTTSSTFVISLILGEAAVGIYSAAVLLAMPIRVVGNVLGIGIFPTLVRAHRAGVEIFRKASSRSIELIVALVLPAVVGLVVTGNDILGLVYGRQEFADSKSVLNFVAWSAFAMAVASILGRVLVSADRELLTLRISVIAATVQILFSVPLTYRFGVAGAAAATLVGGLLNFGQLYLPLRKQFSPYPIFRPTWRPIAASAVMVIALITLGSTPVLVRIVAGVLVYAASFVGISILAAGGRDALIEDWRLEISPTD